MVRSCWSRLVHHKTEHVRRTYARNRSKKDACASSTTTGWRPSVHVSCEPPWPPLSCMLLKFRGNTSSGARPSSTQLPCATCTFKGRVECVFSVGGSNLFSENNILLIQFRISCCRCYSYSQAASRHPRLEMGENRCCCYLHLRVRGTRFDVVAVGIYFG